jgi:uncharacterized protein YraI
VKKKIFSAVLLAVMVAGCSFQVNVVEAPTPTSLIATVTLFPSATPPPTLTALPLPPTSTAVPVDGTTSTQVNVRAEPNTTSEVVGVIPANSPVQIVGKDPGENWWQILFSQGADGRGWVTAEFIATTGGATVPVVGGVDEGSVGIIQQQINVRSGPGTNFNSLGTMNAQDVVTVTGRDANGAWLQILFSAGPDGKGWVNAAFVQVDGVEALPIVGETGQVIGTGTPANTAAAVVPTIAPAPLDNDSAVAPAINVSLTANGSRSFQYSSDVSSPTGDLEDWIQFKTYSVNTKLELECEGSESYVAELLLNNSVAMSLACGKIILFLTDPNAVYAVHFVSSPTGGLEYTKYVLRVEALP